MANKNLNAAKTAKKDEFYTQLVDIERELQHYWQHFRDKVVLCNCDDPYESNFFKYFALRFNQLGLKKLICTCYNGSPVQGNELLLRFEPWDDEAEIKKKAYKVEITEVKDLNGDGAVDLSDVRYLLQNDKNVLTTLQTGDFRDPECIELLKQVAQQQRQRKPHKATGDAPLRHVHVMAAEQAFEIHFGMISCLVTFFLIVTHSAKNCKGKPY